MKENNIIQTANEITGVVKAGYPLNGSYEERLEWMRAYQREENLTTTELVAELGRLTSALDALTA